MSSNDRFKSARLKIDWASQHIDNINEMLSEKRHFRYVVETDAKTGWRTAYAERDEPVIDELALRCGDAVHNLRSTIDQAYTAVVRPFAGKPGQAKTIQFPMHERRTGLESVAKTRLTHKVGPEFLAAILALEAHGEKGGNKLLYFMHSLDTPDKHAHLIPVGYFIQVRVNAFRRLFPDFLPGVTGDSEISVGQNRVDFEWPSRPFTLNEWISTRVPASGKLKQQVYVPIDVCFEGRGDGGVMLTIPTLHQFVDVANHAVNVIARCT